MERLGEAMMMDDSEKTRAEQEARGQVREARRTTAYGRAINRYLGSFSYVDPYADRAPAADAADAADAAEPAQAGSRR